MPEAQQFDDLVAALQSDRPRIDPAFARRLDQRATDGFGRPPRLRRLRVPRPPLWLGMPAAAVASLVLVVVVIAGTTDGGDGGSASSSSSSSGAAAPQAARDSAAAVPTAAGTVAQGGRVQEQTAGLTLVAPAKTLAEVGDQVIAVTDGVGGYVVSSGVSTSSGGSYALRVPVVRLDDALARLSRLGHVQERTQGSQDITAERNGAGDRLREARAERRSLLARLARAATDQQVAALKARLGDVNGALATARTSLTRVQRRARFAAVQVTLEAKSQSVVPADDGRWTPGDALHDAGRVLEVAASVLVVVGSVLLPLALLALLAVAAQRLTARRGRDRMLETV